MKDFNRIQKKTLQRSSAKLTEYNNLVNEIIALDKRIFDHNQSRAEQIDKVFRDSADDDNIACLIYKGENPIGYCFVKIIYIKLNQKRVRAIQGVVGILPGRHGGNIVFPTYLSLCLKYLFDSRCDTYGVGFITSPNLYASSAKFASKFYPSPNYQDPNCEEAIVLQKVIDHWKMEPVQNTNSPFFITEDLVAVDSFDIEPRNKEEAFFFKFNPEFKKGHYLGFCVKFALFRFLLTLVYLIQKRVKKRLFKRVAPSKLQAD